MNAYILDDETSSRTVLKFYLNQYFPNIKIAGESDRFEEALAVLHKLKVDVLFLDVNLGNHTGFELLDALWNFEGAVIIISAHVEYAVNAFKYNAAYYLLKPIEPLELIKAVRKIGYSPEEEQVDTLTSVIAVPYKSGLKTIDVDEILFIEANGSYSNIVMTNESVITISKNLKFLTERLLPYQQFLRVHNSYIVNRNYVIAYLKDDRGHLELKNKQMIPVSSTYKKEIRQMFEHQIMLKP